ncbi:unnamed protein product [Oikopleura dioica]|uniref:Uncharacterized protein n=1 Tax=Oikopleura dioica TaxID=34765 RepID=E4Y4A0_OIKDI|nr:unnamed protein product [Oikopleura dioica]
MKIFAFLIPVFLSQEYSSYFYSVSLPDQPECNSNQRSICQKRGFQCFGKWNRWGGEIFECRKTCSQNCGRCSTLGTEYQFVELTEDRLQERRRCYCKAGYVSNDCAFYTLVQPDFSIAADSTESESVRSRFGLFTNTAQNPYHYA